MIPLLPTSDVKTESVGTIINLLDSAKDLIYDETDDQLYYLDDNGEKVLAPDLSEGMSKSDEWLCDKLPQPVIDFDQGGSVRKSTEMRSIYTTVCIGNVVDSFKPEIKEFISNYDFGDCSIVESRDKQFDDYSSATDYLKSFSDLNSLRINVIISAAAININTSLEKKKTIYGAQSFLAKRF